MRLVGSTMVDDRARNWLRTDHYINSKNEPVSVRIAFNCDDCGAPASYGCVDHPGEWLRCTACNVVKAYQ